jgi:hypothetical protein
VAHVVGAVVRRGAAEGFVEVDAEELVRLQREALAASVLEASVNANRAERAAYERAARARELVEMQSAAAGVALEPIDVSELLAVLPMTPVGALHEPAFLALLGHVLVARRMTLIHDANGDVR